MAFSVSVPKDALAEKVATAARALSAKTIVQTLGGIHLSATAESLAISATDMEMSVRTTIPTIALGEGDVLVPGRLLAEIVRVLPSGDVSLALDKDEKTLHVRAGKAKYRIDVLRSNDFPKIADPEDILASEGGTFFELDAATFLGAVAKVSPSAAVDAARPTLCGILVRIVDGKLVVAATDSYRLSVYETEIESLADFDAIVPARALAEVARFAAGAIRLVTNGRKLLFETAETTLSTRLLDGQFPAYEQIIPETFEYNLVIDRAKVLDVVRRTAVVASGTTPLRLRFKPKQLEVYVRTPEVGESKETVSVPFDGDPLEVGMNPAFFESGLASFDGAKVSLRMVGPLRPLVLEGDGLRYLAMPVRLAS